MLNVALELPRGLVVLADLVVPFIPWWVQGVPVLYPPAPGVWIEVFVLPQIPLYPLA
jgi:hypothetical protein